MPCVVRIQTYTMHRNFFLLERIFLRKGTVVVFSLLNYFAHELVKLPLNHSLLRQTVNAHNGLCLLILLLALSA